MPQNIKKNDDIPNHLLIKKFATIAPPAPHTFIYGLSSKSGICTSVPSKLKSSLPVNRNDISEMHTYKLPNRMINPIINQTLSAVKKDLICWKNPTLGTFLDIYNTD